MDRFLFRFSNRLPFEVGQRVQVIGEPGVYLVVRIDRRRCVADLMLTGQNARVEFGIHFAAIEALPDVRSIAKAPSDSDELALEGAESHD